MTRMASTASTPFVYGLTTMCRSRHLFRYIEHTDDTNDSRYVYITYPNGIHTIFRSSTPTPRTFSEYWTSDDREIIEQLYPRICAYVTFFLYDIEHRSDGPAYFGRGLFSSGWRHFKAGRPLGDAIYQQHYNTAAGCGLAFK